MRILVVEDEEAIASVLKRGLEEAGYVVTVAVDGKLGLELASTRPYHLVILDLMLPGIDGMSICREIREARNSVPILMLTARDAVDDRVTGLEIGADDYLPKPFEFKELLARVHALLRRDKLHKARKIQVADLEIDTAAHSVRRGGKEIALSPREYDLLEALASQEGRVLTREVIQERVWMAEDSFSNTVDVYVGSLRKKIDAGQRQKLIRTVHGVGYVLKCDHEGRE
jgi:DNA-binding response OmpR family regulator